ncbi:MAG: glycosyltransferase family 4 protein [Gammaproteobacteria bacterium]|nr:glycosyltransferase family 4 protein [Gammaproteobacteria bacterium]
MKPRVLFLGPVPPPFMGPSLATVVILNSRLREEFELIHLDTSDPRELDTLGAFDFQNVCLALKFYLQMFVAIVRHRPALVYIPVAQTTLGYLKDSGFILIAKLLGRRVLCHLRGGNFGNWLAGASAATRAYVKVVHGMVDGQIVLGECLRGLFTPIMAADRIHVVTNGKDIAYELTPPRSGKLRVLYLGNMIRTKGVLDALHATPAIHSACTDVEFLFGGGWEDPAVKAEVESFLAANPQLPIRWLGLIKGSEKNQAIASADIFLFPTYYPPEGHPWVVVEAMAAGLPVISTDQGAIVESVVDGVNGYIVPKRDPAAIAARTIALARDEKLRKAMGSASLRLYREKFTEERMVENMARAFRAVLARR